MGEKVMVAMSGGVDSSVAALLLQREGYEISGATLKLFDNRDVGLDDSYTSTCCSIDDVYDARRVALRLGFQHHVFGFRREFARDVIGRFVEDYANGRTPNPCIDCNRFVKFPLLLRRAKLLGQDRIATGHYARVQWDERSGRWALCKAMDATKDQSYVLWAMTQEELSHTLFPLGDLLKSEVRSLAEAAKLPTAQKPDSQDICFVPNGDYGSFLTDVMDVPVRAGKVVDPAGNVVGEHRGLHRYTIGQRKGLPASFGEARYVTGIDAATGTLTIGAQADLFAREMLVGEVNWIAADGCEGTAEVRVKARYRHEEQPATITPEADGHVHVCFHEPQRALTPGQCAVFYDGDRVVGGGVIEMVYGEEKSSDNAVLSREKRPTK